MPIIAYIIRPSATNWSDLKKVTLDGVPDDKTGRLEYRHSMYKVLKCEAFESMRFDLEPTMKNKKGKQDEKMPKTSGFLVWDDAFQNSQPKANQLLHSLGIPVRGPVLMVSGKRILGNTRQYEFDSVSDLPLRPSRVEETEESIKREWVARSTRQLPVHELVKHEHAWEWHQQSLELVNKFHAKLDHLQDPENFSCGACQSKSDKLSRCSSCQVVVYCSRKCQKRHWKEHITFCTTVKTLREKKA